VKPGPTAPIPIIILNWNGVADTLACLQSIKEADSDGFLPVVIDNGSDAAAVDQLRTGLREMFPSLATLGRDDVNGMTASSLRATDAVLIENGENLGFAAGSNIGIRFARQSGSDWALLLNNDTVIAPETLAVLRAFRSEHPEVAAVTAQIRHFNDRGRVQNCGGDLTFLGSRRYRFAERPATDVPATPSSTVTFATGCALLIDHRRTGPLSEDFFFGEEDYEFALRLRRQGLTMACAHHALVFHKGGASIKRAAGATGYIAVHYASRLINVRTYYGPLRWQLTRLAAYLYLPVLLARSGVNPARALRVIRDLQRFVREHRAIGRTDFLAMLGQ
jgi:GT2 family glycosyltransferase